jgi:hypothetical protein
MELANANALYLIDSAVLIQEGGLAGLYIPIW